VGGDGRRAERLRRHDHLPEGEVNVSTEDTFKEIQKFVAEHGPAQSPKHDMAWMTPPMVSAEALSLMSNQSSGPSALERNLARMAEGVRSEAIAEFTATPEAKAAQAEEPPVTARELCAHGRRNCGACHDMADVKLARERWWSGEPGLLLPWYCRDHERAVYGLEPDGLWNGPTPCGATIAGVPEADRAAREARHRETCIHGCADASDADLDGPASGYTAVEVDMAEAEAYGDTVPEDGRWRPKLAHPRGRWRSKKRALRQLADELGYPECLGVAHLDQIDGGVIQAGVRLRDFYKLHQPRTTPAQAKAEWAQQRADKREMARTIAKVDPPF
jgi:hypothetical protein